MLESFAAEKQPELWSNEKDYLALIEKYKNKPAMPWD